MESEKREVKSEKPILFKTEMIRAILNGDKTQTRRVIKPQPDSRVNHIEPMKGAFWEFSEYYPSNGGTLIEDKKCPYGQSGDELWVRETTLVWIDSEGEKRYQCHGYDSPVFKTDHDWDDCYGEYKLWNENGKQTSCWKMVPSIFMPREASRIQLKVEDIRVERVQQITQEDAYKEGCEGYHWNPAGADLSDVGGVGYRANVTPRDDFSYLWDAINADRDYPWDSNPWVWVIEFEVLSTENQ